MDAWQLQVVLANITPLPDFLLTVLASLPLLDWCSSGQEYRIRKHSFVPSSPTVLSDFVICMLKPSDTDKLEFPYR